MSCGGFGFKPPKPKVVEKEYYECDTCDFVGKAYEFELADKDGQLCSECVLESF